MLNQFSSAGPYEDAEAFHQFERDTAVEREWSDVLWAATQEADRRTAVLIETDSLDVDHERQQVTFAWSARVDSTDLLDLAKALECAAVAIRKAVAMVRDARMKGGA